MIKSASRSLLKEHEGKGGGGKNAGRLGKISQ